MSSAPSLPALADSLAPRIPELTALVRRRLRDEVPEFELDLDPALAVSEAERVGSALRSLIDGLAGADEPGSALIADAADEARSAAQAGLRLESLVRTYRVGQAALWDVLVAEVELVFADPTDQLAVQKGLARFQFEWNDIVTAEIIRAYQDEQQQYFGRSAERRLRAELRDLLSGRIDGLTSSSYPFAGTHVGAVVWGDGVESTTRCLERALAASATLQVTTVSGAVLAWFAVAAESVQPGVLDELDVPEGGHVAVGKPAAQVAGFRRTHRQAWVAYRVGRWCALPTTSYEQVALEALFLRDLQAADDLVTQQLGRLHLSDPRTDVLCETLRVYFRSGCNAAETATRLGVHERTVAYRLRSVSERLGHEVGGRQDELIVALRLHKMLRTIAASRSSADAVRAH